MRFRKRVGLVFFGVLMLTSLLSVGFAQDEIQQMQKATEEIQNWSLDQNGKISVQLQRELQGDVMAQYEVQLAQQTEKITNQLELVADSYLYHEIVIDAEEVLASLLPPEIEIDCFS